MPPKKILGKRKSRSESKGVSLEYEYEHETEQKSKKEMRVGQFSKGGMVSHKSVFDLE